MRDVIPNLGLATEASGDVEYVLDVNQPTSMGNEEQSDRPNSGRARLTHACGGDVDEPGRCDRGLGWMVGI
jgi:hypothetical protein